MRKPILLAGVVWMFVAMGVLSAQQPGTEEAKPAAEIKPGRIPGT